MALSDKLTLSELPVYGFRVVEERKAKHERYPSFRHKCHGCGLWFKQLQGNPGRMLCLKCFTSSN